MAQIEVLHHDSVDVRLLLESRDRLHALSQASGEGGEVASVSLPPALLKLLLRAVDQLSQGRDLAIVALEAQISPQNAATLLGVSRPHVLELIKAGALTSHRVGSHHRLPLEAVLAYAHQREGGTGAMALLTQEAQDWGLY